MKLHEILVEYGGMWTAQLSDIVNFAVDYYTKHPESEEGRILRFHIAPMLSHAHDHPDDIEHPDHFQFAMTILRSSMVNPVASSLKKAVEELHRAMPDYHESDQNI